MSVSATLQKMGNLQKIGLQFLLATSMAGEKLRPLVIGKSANPRCFSKQVKDQMKVFYESNKKAWMTSKIFPKWLNQINNKIIINDRKILLLMDNCGAHIPLTLSNVIIVFFVFGMTSGMISNFLKRWTPVNHD